jgi:hypothetical protein
MARQGKATKNKTVVRSDQIRSDQKEKRRERKYIPSREEGKLTD